MKTLWLARHGQSLSNAVRRFQGMQDVAQSHGAEAAKKIEASR